MWGGLSIEYHTAGVTVALGLVLAMVFARVGSWLVESKTHSRRSTAIQCTYMHASRSSTCDINNACIFGIASEYMRKRVWSHVTLFIARVFFFLRFF